MPLTKPSSDLAFHLILISFRRYALSVTADKDESALLRFYSYTYIWDINLGIFQAVFLVFLAFFMHLFLQNFHSNSLFRDVRSCTSYAIDWPLLEVVCYFHVCNSYVWYINSIVIFSPYSPIIVVVLSLFRLFGSALELPFPFRSSLTSFIQGYHIVSLSRFPSPSLCLFVSLFLVNPRVVFLSVVIMRRGSVKPLRTVFLLDVLVKTRSISSALLVSLFMTYSPDSNIFS